LLNYEKEIKIIIDGRCTMSVRFIFTGLYVRENTVLNTPLSRRKTKKDGCKSNNAGGRAG
jgi:hypothetical protein